MSGDIRDGRVLDVDAAAGLTEIYHYDPETEGFTIETVQDVTALVEQNKYLWNADSGERFGELTRVASIPLPIYWALKQEGAIDDPKRFRAWLNNPEHRFFRTRGGRV
jgi:hypothetical protein